MPPSLLLVGAIGTLIRGDVSERPKELASKASVVQTTEGSNPSVTAIVVEISELLDAAAQEFFVFLGVSACDQRGVAADAAGADGVALPGRQTVPPGTGIEVGALSLNPTKALPTSTSTLRSAR